MTEQERIPLENIIRLVGGGVKDARREDKERMLLDCYGHADEFIGEDSRKTSEEVDYGSARALATAYRRLLKSSAIS